MNKDISQRKIVKSNALVSASYRLSVQEQRIILAAISQVNSNTSPTDEIMYSISAENFIGITGQSLKHAYQELKDASLRLMRREVSIYSDPNGGAKKKKVLLTRWVQTISYIDDEGRVELRFGKDVLPYLCQLKEQFTIYHLKDIAKMTSSYGIRIYELLVQWKKVGQKEISIAWLKESFQLSDKYPNIRDLKRRVIEPAIKDINETSDLWVEFSQRKTGRKVTHFIFTFGLKEEPKKIKPSKKPTTSDLKDPKFLSKHGRVGESTPEVVKRLKEQFSI